MDNSLFNAIKNIDIDVVKTEEDKFTCLVDDIARNISMIFVSHIFSYCIDQKGKSFWSTKMLLHVLYSTIALIIYHMIIRQFIII